MKKGNSNNHSILTFLKSNKSAVISSKVTLDKIKGGRLLVPSSDLTAAVEL